MFIEELRPQKLDDVFGQEDIITRLKAFLESPKHMPHLLFAGPPGVGKTTSAIALARELFGESFSENFKEMNASDERRIRANDKSIDIRHKIKKFGQFKPSDGYPFRLLLLDEADALRNDAQSALRRIMEEYSRNLRFIFVVNYSNGIISPIVSRCAVFRFLPLEDEFIRQQIKKVIQIAELDVSPEAISALVSISEGDMRRVLNYLQSLSILTREITDSEVYEIAGMANPTAIDKIVNGLIKSNGYTLEEGYNNIKRLLFVDGFQGKDIIKQFNTSIQDHPTLSWEDKLIFNDHVGNVDFRITQGSNELLQLSTLLAVIYGFRT